jgi:hypothetical protein
MLPSKRLVAKSAKPNRVCCQVKGFPQKWPKQIGFLHFNTGRENLPGRSGADRLMALRFRKRNVSPSKRLAAKSAKVNRFSAFQYWKRNLTVRSGADTLVAL